MDKSQYGHIRHSATYHVETEGIYGLISLTPLFQELLLSTLLWREPTGV